MRAFTYAALVLVAMLPIAASAKQFDETSLFAWTIRDSSSSAGGGRHRVEVQYVIFPAHAHFPRDPVRDEEIYNRWIAWYADHLR